MKNKMTYHHLLNDYVQVLATNFAMSGYGNETHSTIEAEVESTNFKEFSDFPNNCKLNT